MILREFKLRNIFKFALLNWQSSAGVLLISALGLLINFFTIPGYTLIFGFDEWGVIALDLVYYNFFSYLGAFAMNIYLFHSKGNDNKVSAARIIYIIWVSLLIICFTIFWPLNDLRRLLYVQTGLISSLAIFKSGIEWQRNRFVSQRIWLLLPVFIFHIIAFFSRFLKFKTANLNFLVIVFSTMLFIYAVIYAIRSQTVVKKYSKEILSFSLVMMLNFVLSAGVELKLRSSLQTSLSGREWSVFSLGILVYSVHGLIGNNLAPMLNSWIKREFSNFGGFLRVLYIFFLVCTATLVALHFLQLLFFGIFNIWYLVYSLSILIWMSTNILSVQLLNSRVLLLFGCVQLVGFLVFRLDLSIWKYILVHSMASSISFLFALSKMYSASNE